MILLGKAVAGLSKQVRGNSAALLCGRGHLMVEQPARHCICMECSSPTAGGSIIGCIGCDEELCKSCAKKALQCSRGHMLYKMQKRDAMKCKKCGKKETETRSCKQCFNWGDLCLACAGAKMASVSPSEPSESPKPPPNMHFHLFSSYDHKPDSFKQGHYQNRLCSNCNSPPMNHSDDGYDCYACDLKVAKYHNCLPCYNRIIAGMDPAAAAKLSVEDWKADGAKKKEALRVRDENLEKHAREQDALCDQYHRTRHRNAPDCGNCGAKGGNSGNIWMCSNASCNMVLCVPCYKRDHGAIKGDRCAVCSGVWPWCRGHC